MGLKFYGVGSKTAIWFAKSGRVEASHSFATASWAIGMFFFGYTTEVDGV